MRAAPPVLDVRLVVAFDIILRFISSKVPHVTCCMVDFFPVSIIIDWYF